MPTTPLAEEKAPVVVHKDDTAIGTGLVSMAHRRIERCGSAAATWQATAGGQSTFQRMLGVFVFRSNRRVRPDSRKLPVAGSC